jgi:diguanylate cyclase (GGDEF)-like protein/hemerythrin-like metal-binding protein
MNSFQFNSFFLTGIKQVDDQHRRLVDLINEFGESLASMETKQGDIEQIFQELAEYAQYHFDEEESLMQKMHIDARHYDPHIEEHLHFLEDVTSMHSDSSFEKTKIMNQLLNFLIHWLAYHILGSDKNMAKQIEAVQAGISPSEAFETLEKMRDSSTEPLLHAIKGLFQLVSARNKQLKKLNRSLEQKVKERTRKLDESNKHLLEVSITDALTTLPNRRYAMQQLKKFWEESDRTKTSLSLMMIDADHFKEVNDSYGHDAGDLVLCELAKTLQYSVRTDDIVCRLGGDEFLIICPGTDESGVHHIAGIVRKNVSRMKVATGDGFWSGSISVGVASRMANMDHFEDLVKMADRGVYAAKKAGKNCVRAV